MKDPNWGGKRDGAGRKPTGRKQRSYRATDAEHEVIQRLIQKVKDENDRKAALKAEK